MKTQSFRGLFAAITGLSCMSATLLADVSAITLGTLPGWDSSHARFISGDGRIVYGRATNSYTATPAQGPLIRWTGSGPIEPLILPALGTNTWVDIAGCSFDGTTLVGTSRPTVDSCRDNPVRWVLPSSIQSLETFGINACPTGNPRACSSDGATVVGYSDGYAASWNDAGTIASLGAPWQSNAAGISGDGTRTLWYEPTGMYLRSGNITTPIPAPFASVGPVIANALSRDGQVVFGTAIDFNVRRGFRWTAQTGTVWIDQVNGLHVQQVFACSSDGSVAVGTASVSDNSPVVPFIWTPAGGIQDLRQVLVAGGALGASGWSDTYPSGISDDGQTIVGTTRSCGIRAWVARLSGPPLRPVCPANTNGDCILSIDDLFLFLNLWFTNSPQADFDAANGVSIDDLFLFLNQWFVGCSL